MNRFIFLSLLMVTACGDDDAPLDTGPSDAADEDVMDQGSADCTALANGVACGEGLICILEMCVSSQCGDGYVDARADEECDDGNTEDGDGCDSCAFSCTNDMACDDDDPCTGTEICAADHSCTHGIPPMQGDGIECVMADEMAGVCNGGLCAAPGCGDSVINGSEQCDDGNDVNDDGCDTDCTFSCVEDADCRDENSCNGEETCDVSTHSCAPGEALFCDDGEACTDDSCDLVAGCQYTLIDADEDGYSAIDCIDEALNDHDCNDDDANVFPGQTDYFSSATTSTPAFDYNCDNIEEARTTTMADGDCRSDRIVGRCLGGGWSDIVPACGEEAVLRACAWVVSVRSCTERLRTVPQRCR